MWSIHCIFPSFPKKILEILTPTLNNQIKKLLEIWYMGDVLMIKKMCTANEEFDSCSICFALLCTAVWAWAFIFSTAFSQFVNGLVIQTPPVRSRALPIFFGIVYNMLPQSLHQTQTNWTPFAIFAGTFFVLGPATLVLALQVLLVWGTFFSSSLLLWWDCCSLLNGLAELLKYNLKLEVIFSSVAKWHHSQHPSLNFPLVSLQ